MPRHPRAASLSGPLPAALPPAPVIANAYGSVAIPPSMPAPMPADPLAIARMLQEQQLRAQQMMLQQQLMSASGANNQKTQKEARAARRVYVGNLTPHMVGREEVHCMQLVLLMLIPCANNGWCIFQRLSSVPPLPPPPPPPLLPSPSPPPALSPSPPDRFGWPDGACGSTFIGAALWGGRRGPSLTPA